MAVHSNRIKITVFVVIIAVVGILCTLFLLPKLNNANLTVTAVEEVGLVQNPQHPELIRDGGVGAAVGGRYLWTFGDTLFNPKSVDGVNARSITAGYAEISNPLSVSEPLDANRAPSQFIPLPAADQAYNEKTKKGDDRYAIWPSLVVARPDQKDALVFFLRLKVNPGGGGLNYDLLNTGIARVTEGSTQAEVVVPELFKKPEKLYGGPGFVKDGYIYLYECSNKSEKACSFARTSVDSALERPSYTFWNGKNWQPDYQKSAAKYPGTSTGTSIGYVPAINQYAIFYNKPFSKEMYVSTSKELTSGWSTPKKFYEATANNYALTYHPDLTTNNGKTLLLTYYQPKSGMHAIHMTLQ